MTATRHAGRPAGGAVDVQQPGRLVECAQLARQAGFQQLVRQYLSQILHGCKSAYCTTPSCLSSSRRNAARPLRPPTQLTARALAHYLASQDNPRRGLCPHELRVPPDAVEVGRGGDAGASIRQRSTGSGLEYVVYPPVWRSSRRENPALADAVTARRQAKKDVKSLAQNLYDTATVITSYSKQLPAPDSVFALLRAADHGPDGAANTPADTPPANHPPATRSVNDTPRIARQQLQHNLRQAAPELLSNGQRLHKIPYQPPLAASPGKPAKSKTSSAVDGMLETPRLVGEKSGKLSTATGVKGHTSIAVPKHTQKITPSVSQKAPVLPVIPILNCDILNKLKDNVCRHHKKLSNHFDFVVDFDTNRPLRRANPIVNRSLFYTLSDSETLLKSFHDHNEAFRDSPLAHLDSARLTHSFRDWDRQNGALIFDSLWHAVEALFTPPPELNIQKCPRQRRSSSSASGDSILGDRAGHHKVTSPAARYLSNHEAAHIVLICTHALTSLVSCGWTHTWAQVRNLRSWGVVIPPATPNTDAFSHPYINIIDELEYEPALRLADRLLRGIGARTCFEHILASMNQAANPQDDAKHDLPEPPPKPPFEPTLADIIIQHLKVTERNALASKQRMGSTQSAGDDPGWTVTATFMEWLRTIIIKKWDSKAEINKWGSVGTALSLLDKFHAQWKALNLRPNMFGMPFFNERLDAVEEPLRFLDWSSQPNTVHILEFPSLFPPQHLVAYFRTINFTNMMAEYETTARVHQMQRFLDIFLREPYGWVINYRMRVALSDYLVLDVSREDALKDTLDQLWGLEKKMLMKPLKVKMGQHEGEVGVDHGGVTYEYFRVVLSEAFKPENGMFTVDPKSRMTWFQPGTLEPDWKFELLGILFSLALYNGITLPVTFPLALYFHLLQSSSVLPYRDVMPQDLDYIRDGWPGLASAFSTLLEWSDGDVEDAIMREYVFSYEAFGQMFNHDMIRSSGLSTSNKDKEVAPGADMEQGEPPMVTNANREQFVKDYVFHLTYHSVKRQLTAFVKGFMVCINAKSLCFFTPATLRNLVEGIQDISISDLRRCAKYEEGYSATHQTIVDFWSIAEQYSQENRRRLLEFVTASDRVPVTGYESITFHISRISGESQNLPTSSTCFGKLYLPEYGDKNTMKRKLDLAVQNAQGFGFA